jgi:hypothetical protein
VVSTGEPVFEWDLLVPLLPVRDLDILLAIAPAAEPSLETLVERESTPVVRVLGWEEASESFTGKGGVPKSSEKGGMGKWHLLVNIGKTAYFSLLHSGRDAF